MQGEEHYEWSHMIWIVRCIIAINYVSDLPIEYSNPTALNSIHTEAGVKDGARLCRQSRKGTRTIRRWTGGDVTGLSATGPGLRPFSFCATYTLNHLRLPSL